MVEFDSHRLHTFHGSRIPLIGPAQAFTVRTTFTGGSLIRPPYPSTLGVDGWSSNKRFVIGRRLADE